MRFERSQHGGRNPRALRQLGEGEAFLGDVGYRRRFFRLLSAALDSALDHPQRIAPLLEIADEVQALEMPRPIPGDASFMTRRR